MTVRILIGDVRERLAAMAPDSVDVVVTSPPYWGLRDYGVDGQIGLEPTLGAHLDAMVEVFRLVRRVLKPSGTLWLNYGDCYATTPNGRSAADTKAAGGDDRTFRDKPFSTVGPIYGSGPGDADRRGSRSTITGGAPHHTPGRIIAGGFLKPKDLCMIPARLAIALQDDGWFVRSENIWGKTNPMPESVSDRPATAFEKVFQLSRAPKYFYDAGRARQPSIGKTHHDLTGGGYSPPGQAPQTSSRTRYPVPAGWDTSKGEGGHGSVHRDGRRRNDSFARAPCQL